MAQPVVHFEIEGINVTALRSFYSDLFGWQVEPVPNDPSYGLVAREANADGAGIGGAVSAVPDQPSPTWRGSSRADGYRGHVTVYVEVPDVQAALDRVEQLGGTPMMGPDPAGGGIQIGKFLDPEGHLIGLVSQGSDT